MTITTDDIKLLKSEVLLDVENGGGAMTGNEIIDGQSNNLFPDVSSLDRVYGRTSLRKGFAAVLTQDTDSYLGSHMIVTKPPVDPDVSATLFNTGDWFDVRTNAQNRVESFLIKGRRLSGQLLETQVQGTRTIVYIQKPDQAIPRINQSLVLSENEGASNEVTQFVRVADVTVERVLIPVSSGSTIVDMLVDLLTIEITEPLVIDFHGPDANLLLRGGTATLRDTMVADSARYYGVAPLAQTAAIGNTQVKVSSIYTQLVPSTQQEIPFADQDPLLRSTSLLPARKSGSGRANEVLTNASIVVGTSLYLMRPIYPGTLTITRTNNPAVFEDSGSGYLTLQSTGAVVAQIDYAAGTMQTLDGWPVGSTSDVYTFEYRPAVAPSLQQQSLSVYVEEENRGFVYVMTLAPTPALGSITVSYRAQGQWYDLFDQGGGILRGSDPSFGAGTVNVTTGTLSVTLGALPDAGTAIVIAWGTQIVATALDNSNDGGGLTYVFALDNAPVDPTTVSIQFVSWSGGAITMTGNAAGVLTPSAGTSNGTIDPVTGIVRIRERQADATKQFTCAYSSGDPEEATGTISGSSPWIFNFDPNITPGTFKMDLTMGGWADTFGSAGLGNRLLYSGPATLKDNGSGQVVLAATWNATPVGTTVGTINYSTGTVQIADTATTIHTYQVETMVSNAVLTQPNYNGLPPNMTEGSYRYDTFSEPSGYIYPQNGTTWIARYNTAASTPTTNEIHTATQFEIPVALSGDQQLVPGSFWARLVSGSGQQDLYDNSGTLYRTKSKTTGAGVVCGSMNYQTGKAIISSAGMAGLNALIGILVTCDVLSAAGQFSPSNVNELVFRVPTAPVRTGSVQITWTEAETGLTRSVTPDSNGAFQTSYALGFVNYQTGLCQIRFGDYLTITSANVADWQGAPWYDEDALIPSPTQDPGATSRLIFRPRPAVAETIRFNAVGVKYLPLDSALLGISTVRLPQDGRVPIFRPGDVVVIHNTDDYELSSPDPLDTFDLGRTLLSWAKLYDAADTPVPDNMYTVDLDTGVLTLTADFSLTGLVEPLKCLHRIEDMALCTDAQINGVLGISKPLSHNYGTTGTMVSSALIFGDLQARVSVLFEQQTFSTTWRDTPVGDPIVAQYNSTLYPLILTNQGATEERWAIIFTGTTTFRVVGEHVGQIATGTTSEDCQPINPATGVPYFKIDYRGWGGGWQNGNCLRFNTKGGNHPFWVARTVLSGDAPVTQDRFQLQVRGDIDV